MPIVVRCVQIVATIGDGSAGPSYSVARLSTELRRGGTHVSLRTVRGWRETLRYDKQAQAPPHVAYSQDFSRTTGLAQMCISRDLNRALLRSARDSDIFHTHGMWLMPNVYPAWASRGSSVALVVSPRGMLGREALRFSSAKKAVFWHLWQKDAIRSAACIHATSKSEYDEIREVGLTNPVAIIPNGIDLPEPRLTRSTKGAGDSGVVLYLGRLHPKKGLDQLVRSWAKGASDRPNWRLRIVGPDELRYGQHLRALIDIHKLSGISVEEPIYGDDRLAAYREADVVVLPTLNDNFAMTVAESLAAGTPVISTKGAPWSGLETEGCGWWIDHGVDPLAGALAVAMATPRQRLEEMGENGRRWMARDFSWRRVASDMLDVYRWLSGDAETPATVRHD